MGTEEQIPGSAYIVAFADIFFLDGTVSAEQIDWYRASMQALSDSAPDGVVVQWEEWEDLNAMYGVPVIVPTHYN